MKNIMGKLMIMITLAAHIACAPEAMTIETSEKPVTSSECNIESFSMAGVSATIGESDVTLIVKKGYAGNMKFTTQIEVSDGATIYPGNETNADFSTAKEYTVTARDGRQKKYIVKVVRAGEGLYVNDSKLMLDGKPFYTIGINYFDMFYRAFVHAGAKQPVALGGLQVLANKGIKVVRFAASPYWPIEWRESYLTDKDAYFAEMDKIVAKAEELGIGLIPSLFWNLTSIPDAVGEHFVEYSNPASKTTQFLQAYTNEVVSRYCNSPAIYGWEFGNEYALSIDIPNSVSTNTNPDLGEPVTRDQVLDRLTQVQMQAAFKIFVDGVRSLDATRPVFSGNALPRSQAYNNLFNNSWAKDNREQFKYMLNLNESKMNTLCVHIYYNHPSEPNMLNITSMDGILTLLMRNADELNKPLFVGEFGVSTNWFTGNKTGEKAQFKENIDAIVANRVHLSCAWNFDRSGDGNDEWSITENNARSYMLDMIVDANKKLEEFR